MTVELLPEHLSKLEEMNALLRISQDCTIAFVRCNEPVLRDAVNAEIKKRVGDEVFIYEIKMDENSYNLLSLLNEAVSSDSYSSLIKDNKKLAFFVFGLDKALEKKNPDGKSEALVVLNMMREEFLKIKHAIIIWINSASLSDILREAQDFFSWRTTVFEFDMVLREVQRPSAEFEDTELLYLTKKELEERWGTYSGLLKDYKKKGIEDAHKFAYWNYNMGLIKLLQGHAEEALKYFENSINFSEKIKDRKGVENSLRNLGNTYSDLGQTKKAIDYFEKALTISREIRDRRREEKNIGSLGNAYIEHGQFDKAIEYIEQAYAISRENGDRLGEAVNVGNLGIAYSYQGQIEKSIQYYDQALALSREIGYRRGEGLWLGNLGTSYHSQGQLDKAMNYYKQALDISREIGGSRMEGIWLVNLGNGYSDMGHDEKAIEYYEQALAIGREIKDPRITNFCEIQLKNLKKL